MAKLMKHQLKDHALKAQDAELRTVYRELVSWMDKWQQGQMTGIELSERINRLQAGPVREVNNLHMGLTQEMRIARAIARGLVSPEDLPADLLPSVLPHVEYYRGLIPPKPVSQAEIDTPPG